jgi:hypothetical protein
VLGKERNAPFLQKNLDCTTSLLVTFYEKRQHAHIHLIVISYLKAFDVQFCSQPNLLPSFYGKPWAKHKLKGSTNFSSTASLEVSRRLLISKPRLVHLNL